MISGAWTLAATAGRAITDRMMLNVVAAAHGVDMEKVKSVSDLYDVPSPVLEEHADTFCSGRLKSRVMAYEDGHRGSYNIIVGPSGALVLQSGYDMRQHLDTHNLMLPTVENIDKAAAEWADAQRKRTMSGAHPSARGRCRSYKAIHPPRSRALTWFITSWDRTMQADRVIRGRRCGADDEPCGYVERA